MIGMMKTNSTAQGGRTSISRASLDFERAPGNEIDDARDDGLEMIPQPRFQQEQQREEDPERAEPDGA